MDLPIELLPQILITLPLKSSVRFSCVSKSWQYEVSLHILARPRKVFALSKYNKQLSRTQVVSHGEKPIELLTNFDDLDYDFPYPVEIVGSCNGLVCVRVMLGSPLGRFKIILWNPATNQFNELPPFPEDRILANTVEHGFGYDESNDDYKVVESNYHNGEYWLKIYSLNSNSWRLVSRTSRTYDQYLLHTSSVFVHDSIHWLYSTGILAVNLITEDCTIMELPPCSIRLCEMLGVLEDRLCLSSGNKYYRDYWMMNEYGVKSSWTKLMCIQLYQGRPGGNLDMSSKVLEYDECSGKSHAETTIMKACQFNEIPSTIDYVKFRCATYSETLVSVSPLKKRTPKRSGSMV